MSLESYKYTRGDLTILDQLLLPREQVYISVRGVDDGWAVINKMQVRGAPLIGVIAALSVNVEIDAKTFANSSDLIDYVTRRFRHLVTARPTAVNIQECEKRFVDLLTRNSNCSLDVLKEKLQSSIEEYAKQDRVINETMAEHGCAAVLSHMNRKGRGQSATVITHCNTGSLATAGYGTALGVVRALHGRKRLERCYCTETRPYNQGSRLTAYELKHDNIPSTLICDSMVSALMKSKQIHAVLVGADRVAANGDTANKIGTYQLAIAAKYHDIPFFVVAPVTSIDLNIDTGASIVIEERPSHEMTLFNGLSTAPQGMPCWNPAFDVTPNELITGIVTEYGVFKPLETKQKVTSFANKKV